jgi:hypothetical protein
MKILQLPLLYMAGSLSLYLHFCNEEILKKIISWQSKEEQEKNT